MKAYLMKYQRMSLKSAFIFVKERRNKSKPNNTFFQQLVNYEKKLFGKNSVKMVQVVRDEVRVTVPDFYEKDFPDLLMLDIEENRIQK